MGAETELTNSHVLERAEELKQKNIEKRDNDKQKYYEDRDAYLAEQQQSELPDFWDSDG